MACVWIPALSGIPTSAAQEDVDEVPERVLSAIALFEAGRPVSGVRIQVADDEPLPDGLSIEQLAPDEERELVVGERDVLYLRLGTANRHVTMMAYPTGEGVFQAPFPDCVAGFGGAGCTGPANRTRPAGSPPPRVRFVHPWLPDVAIDSRTAAPALPGMSPLANDASVGFLRSDGAASITRRDESMLLGRFDGAASVGPWWFVSRQFLWVRDQTLWIGTLPTTVSGAYRLRANESVGRVCEDGRQRVYVAVATETGSRVLQLTGGQMRELFVVEATPERVTCVRAGGVVAVGPSSDELTHFGPEGRRVYRVVGACSGTRTARQAGDALWVSGDGCLAAIDLAPLTDTSARPLRVGSR